MVFVKLTYQNLLFVKHGIGSTSINKHSSCISLRVQGSMPSMYPAFPTLNAYTIYIYIYGGYPTQLDRFVPVGTVCRRKIYYHAKLSWPRCLELRRCKLTISLYGILYFISAPLGAVSHSLQVNIKMFLSSNYYFKTQLNFEVAKQYWCLSQS